MIIKIRGLEKKFGQTEVIAGVNLDIMEGERHSIIGPNGAGKSTLFNLITGYYNPTAGSINFREREIAGHKPHEISRMGLSRSFQITNIFPNMTVFENIRCSVLWSLGHKYSFWDRVDKLEDVTGKTQEILDDLEMRDRSSVIAGELSYAEQRLLEIGVTIGGGAEVILLDEPTAGLSKKEISEVIQLVLKVTRGKTLMLVEHDMDVVFSISDRISVLVYGKIIASGDGESIRSNKRVQEAYLGAIEG